MNLLRAIAGAVAICVLASPQPAHAQISPNAVWSCEFTNSPTDCGLYLEAAASTRATLVGPGRDGPTAVQLTTQPGDINIAGSGSNERADLVLARSSTYCNQGQDEWWAHSLMFPPGYVPPPVASVWNWGALFDFHNSSPGGGQPNFMVYATPTGLELHMAGGPNTVNLPSDPGYYSIVIGPITKNVWYDFVYHVKWSSGADGLFQAWLNGQQVRYYSGADLYVGQRCYLMIAQYHNEAGGAGLTVGTVTMQSSTTVPSGNVIGQNPAAGAQSASGSAVDLVVSTGGGTSSGGGGGGASGGGGAFDSFTLAALLSSLIGGLWRARRIRDSVLRRETRGLRTSGNHQPAGGVGATSADVCLLRRVRVALCNRSSIGFSTSLYVTAANSSAKNVVAAANAIDSSPDDDATINLRHITRARCNEKTCVK